MSSPERAMRRVQEREAKRQARAHAKRMGCTCQPEITITRVADTPAFHLAHAPSCVLAPALAGVDVATFYKRDNLPAGPPPQG